MISLRFTCIVLALLCSACSTHRPWTNATAMTPSQAYVVSADRHRSMMVAVTLSGGGTRAAAFGLGVLRELKNTALTWDGRPTTLLDEVGFISGVSGGSILAAHFAAFGDATLQNFERDFLSEDVENRLLRMALAPERLHRLSSPWFGRGHVLAEELETLFQGRSFGDAAARQGAPELLVTATDLRNGQAFEFAAESLGAMCIDWRKIPLSFAVAASASVPLLLSPLTLQNHAGQCNPTTAADHAMRGPAASASDFRSELRAASAASYRDAAARPFVHLVDGGLADNLGVRGLLDRFVADGSISSGFAGVPDGSIRRLVIFVVNAERDVSESIETSDRVPTMGQVLDSLIFGAGARETRVTLAILRQDVQRWSEELARVRGQPGSPFAADAELHAVVVSLDQVPDADTRRALLRLPTSFALSPEEVAALQQAAADVLKNSAAFRDLLRSVGRPTPP